MAKIKQRRAQSAVARPASTLPIIITAAVIVILISGLVIYNQMISKPVVTAIQVNYPTGITADGEPFKGKAEAPVTIEEYADFRCSHCADFAEILNRLDEQYLKTGKVKVIFKNFAFMGQGSTNAALGTECALTQSPEAFWTYHDAMFTNQALGESLYTRSGLKDVAKQLGLDTAAFNTCIDNNQQITEVQQDLTDGRAKGVDSTPTWFINNEKVIGSMDLTALQTKIDSFLTQ